MPQLAERITDTSLEGIAAGCDATAAVLPTAQPVFDSVALMLREMRPQLQQIVAAANEQIQQYDLDLSALESFAATLEGGVADLRAALDPTAQLASLAGSMITSLEQMHLDPSAFQLPAWAPVDLVESAIAPINAGVDTAIEPVERMRDEMVETWREQVEAMIVALQAQIAAFREQISEGGSFRAELTAQVEGFQAAVAAANEALAQWDGNVELDAGAAAAWLRSVADAARAAAAESLAAENQDPWPQILCDTAQPAVDAWRARHEAHVESQYALAGTISARSVALAASTPW